MFKAKLAVGEQEFESSFCQKPVFFPLDTLSFHNVFVSIYQAPM